MKIPKGLRQRAQLRQYATNELPPWWQAAQIVLAAVVALWLMFQLVFSSSTPPVEEASTPTTAPFTEPLPPSETTQTTTDSSSNTPAPATTDTTQATSDTQPDPDTSANPQPSEGVVDDGTSMQVATSAGSMVATPSSAVQAARESSPQGTSVTGILVIGQPTSDEITFELWVSEAGDTPTKTQVVVAKRDGAWLVK